MIKYNAAWKMLEIYDIFIVYTPKSNGNGSNSSDNSV